MKVKVENNSTGQVTEYDAQNFAAFTYDSLCRGHDLRGLHIWSIQVFDDYIYIQVWDHPPVVAEDELERARR